MSIMKIKSTDRIWDIIYTRWKTQNRKPKYILGTDREWYLKWVDYNLFIRKY